MVLVACCLLEWSSTRRVYGIALIKMIPDCCPCRFVLDNRFHVRTYVELTVTEARPWNEDTQLLCRLSDTRRDGLGHSTSSTDRIPSFIRFKHRWCCCWCCCRCCSLVLGRSPATLSGKVSFQVSGTIWPAVQHSGGDDTSRQSPRCNDMVRLEGVHALSSDTVAVCVLKSTQYRLHLCI